MVDATQFLRFNQKPAGSQPPPGMRVFDRVLEFPCIFDIKVGRWGGGGVGLGGGDRGGSNALLEA